jgi:hypothetical protein
MNIDLGFLKKSKFAIAIFLFIIIVLSLIIGISYTDKEGLSSNNDEEDEDDGYDDDDKLPKNPPSNKLTKQYRQITTQSRPVPQSFIKSKPPIDPREEQAKKAALVRQMKKDAEKLRQNTNPLPPVQPKNPSTITKKKSKPKSFDDVKYEIRSVLNNIEDKAEDKVSEVEDLLSGVKVEEDTKKFITAFRNVVEDDGHND